MEVEYRTGSRFGSVDSKATLRRLAIKIVRKCVVRLDRQSRAARFQDGGIGVDIVFSWNDYYNQAKEEGHSEAFVEETLDYANRLLSRNLPVLFSRKHFGIYVGLSYKTLEQIIGNRDEFYKSFKIRKKRGGKREIRAPRDLMKYLQRWILENILKKVEVDTDVCMAFHDKSSIRANALVHADSPVILKMDLYRFFDTITEKRVYGVFHELGYHKNLAIDLARLTTIQSTDAYWWKIKNNPYFPIEYLTQQPAYLPQGAPTSPAISNLVARNLDRRLKMLAKKLGCKYTRYADDLTFSGDMACLPSIPFVEQIIREEGFIPNRSKTMVRKKGQRQTVTGLTVTEGVHVPKAYKKDIWRHLHFCTKYDPISHLQRIGMEDKASYKEWLLGRIHFVKSIEYEVGQKMLLKFEVIKWPL